MAPRSSAKKVSEKVAADLHMLHNPFADTTTQPKIPDGKVNDSLGQTFTDVFELNNKQDAPIMHLLMYAGKFSQLISEGSTNEQLSRGYGTQRFQTAGFINWLTARLVQFNEGGTPDNTTQRIVNDPSQHGLWRIVSCGMQLKLLNAQEEDNGWFEAVRITQPMNSASYVLTTDHTDATATDAQNNEGIIIPYGFLEELKNADLANDPSYSTGLLRDLHRVQFECHGKLDYHDFKQGKKQLAFDFQDEGVGADTAVPGKFVKARGDMRFNGGSTEVMELADNFIDPSYDMVYVRLHCRTNDGTGSLGSKLHCHLTSNQEISYAQSNAFNRFQTKSDTVGESVMGIHFQGRRAQGNAATLIV